MYRPIRRILNAVAVAVSFMVALPALAQEEPWLSPYILSNSSAAATDATVTQVRDALSAAGFEVAGSYSPYTGATVLCITSDALKQAAAKTEFGGYGAVLRVAVTQVGDQVQVSYANPAWVAHSYRMDGNLDDVSAKLEQALGKQKVFGAEEPGWKPSQLRKYHFMMFMPYFDDHWEVAEHASHDAAVQAVEAGLAAHKGGTSKVYRVDIPGKEQTVFGVAFGPDSGVGGDEHVMKIIDFGDLKQTAHLPWELLVSGKKVYGLHAKFRIAVNFPTLDMGTFIKINDAPDAIEAALIKASGGS